ncbi:hypothetical protein GUITHDRAFT_118062 [Guillardia theta CCMP2712]|uniref:Cation-transporting P-type ATPase N-terminal domain-containing protein n=1 Tax=Guillardia theta (strain CCMP2712) TaxID=905079 RepID=L1IJ10_GUITC|nr:hypothetical protein GUITHDRAFT_118062 [Guillardia theta CCMP2712]EKX35785.1 hypothetical protein GUITHDRAFT_118062 [Guillardia theta CCMP2712]|eukprot:XP_005822765.1 hypothetical protein GUITHDRAFT_118062 [Guillardia theta CCMP2712]
MAATAHTKTVQEVLEMCAVDPKVGLSEQEVLSRREIFGLNKMPSKERLPLWKRFVAQFDDKMVHILLAAAGISIFFSFFDAQPDEHPFVEPAVILSILILNACIGVWQAKVLREGKTRIIDAAELVPGDVVEVAVGDKVPADMRVVEMQSTALKVEQAALTGEAASVNKNPSFLSPAIDDELAQKENIMFAATDLVYGKCQGVVIKTGSQTEIGKIAQALTETEDQESPLKEKLDQFGELLTDVIKWICLACWLVNVPQFSAKGLMLTGLREVTWKVWLKGAMHFFKIAVVLAVAAIPEGLPAVVTTCLALGTGRMARRNALVRHLPAVETLGCTSIICSDKTGTLTTNQMSVQRVLVMEKEGYMELEVEGITYAPTGRVLLKNKSVTADDYRHAASDGVENSLNELSKISSLCNQAGIVKTQTGTWERIGESTEAALKVLTEKLGAQGAQGMQGDTPVNDYWSSKYVKLATLEFNRERKSMSVLVASPGEDKVLDRKLSASDPRLQDPSKFEEVESDLTLVGLTGILDPPREEVKGAIQACKRAGIRVMVITGDNPKTAETICRMIGVLEEGEAAEGKSFTGKQWSAMSLEEKRKAIKTAKLFSRTEPIHKKDIVELLQVPVEEGGPGETAAMTGDGVNDAPALKAASIGVAMGSGTSVAQGAAKMVLADDNFISIVGAVEEGRAIYANTKAFIRYLISSNIGEVVCVFLSVLLGLPEVLSPVSLLWVNLVTDGLPATALSFNPAEPGIMSLPPRRRDEQLVDGWMLTRYLLTGIYVGVATVWGYVWWMCVNAQGPRMSFRQLRGNMQCMPGTKFANG